MAKAPKVAAAAKPKGAKRGPKPKGKTVDPVVPAAAADAAANAPVRQVPSENQVKKLAKDVNGYSAEMNTINGARREAIGNAVAKQHLHSKAFGDAVRLSKKEPGQIGEYLDHFEHYCEVLGVHAKADSVQQLPLDSEEAAGPAGGSSEPAEAAGNVSHPRFTGRIAVAAAE